MATYFMNADVNEHTIIPDHSNPSEYQDLIDAYLDGGGKIKKVADGAAEGALDLGKFRAIPTTESEDGWGEFFKEAITQ